MPKLRKRSQEKVNSVARDLLEFRDELDALNACNAFVLQALAGAMESGEAMSSRAATGAVLCAQWLGDRAAELERRLKNIQDRARSVRGPENPGSKKKGEGIDETRSMP